MRRGEKSILVITAVIVLGMMAWNFQRQRESTTNDNNIPFYTTASADLTAQGGVLIRQYECRRCHTLWTMRDMLSSVPAPALDGIGSLHEEGWFYEYLSAENPQLTVPSRLKKEYQMPSYATMPEEERRTLAAYLASLKVKDWYLKETRGAECSALTGEGCP